MDRRTQPEHKENVLTTLYPEGFVSLKPYFTCINYYAGEGGKRIGFTDEDRIRLGLTDPGDVWVHRILAERLLCVRDIIGITLPNLSLVIKDGLRRKEVYRQIIKNRHERGDRIEGLINEKDMPHATGLAVDWSLLDKNTSEPVFFYNRNRDGIAAEKFGFYENHTDLVGREYHRLQVTVHEAFVAQGCEHGVFRECWHEQLKGITVDTPRY